MRDSVSSYVIRLATAADIQALAEVHVASWRTTYSGIIPQSALDQLSVAQRIELWSRAVLDPIPMSAVLVAEADNGQVIGFAACGPERQGGRDYQGELYAIYLLQAVQGRGLGRAFVQVVARYLLAANMHSMLVWVLADNPACGFYTALGGEWVDETVINLGGVDLRELAYGWRDLTSLLT